MGLDSLGCYRVSFNHLKQNRVSVVNRLHRPQLTENRAKALRALLEKIPASVAFDPEVKSALEFIDSLSKWRLSADVMEGLAERQAKNYQWKLENGKGPKNPGIGQGRRPKQKHA